MEETIHLIELQARHCTENLNYEREEAQLAEQLAAVRQRNQTERAASTVELRRVIERIDAQRHAMMTCFQSSGTVAVEEEE